MVNIPELLIVNLHDASNEWAFIRVYFRGQISYRQGRYFDETLKY